MRNRVLGAIGVLWGGAIVVRIILVGAEQGSEAYQTGQVVAAVFGLAMFLVGAYYLFNKQSG